LLYALEESSSKARKKAKSVANMTILLTQTRPQDPHRMTWPCSKGALAKTNGKANADKTIPDVKNAQTSFSAEGSSEYLFMISVGIGAMT